MANGDGGRVFLKIDSVSAAATSLKCVTRRAGASQAPAAARDVRCALPSIHQISRVGRIGINGMATNRHSPNDPFVPTGDSLPAFRDLDRESPTQADKLPLKVAAIVNWFGITNVNGLIGSPGAHNIHMSGGAASARAR